MKTEIEAKFLHVDHDAVRKNLKKAGAVCEQPMRLMRRMIFENKTMSSHKGYLRVRDEGHAITMTYKQFDRMSIDGAKEIEIVVDNFDTATALMKAIDNSWLRISLQESRRETWKLGEAEIVLDEWPWLEPYIEIEAPSRNIVQTTASQLGLDMNDAVYGDVMAAYRRQYPHLGESDTVGSLPEVRFGAPLPAMFTRDKTT